CLHFFFFSSSRPYPHPHSFPTRRSSDLHWPCRRACRKSVVCVPAVWCATDRYRDDRLCDRDDYGRGGGRQLAAGVARIAARPERDRKSTRLNSSHVAISYAVFCLKKKKH